MKIKYFVLQSSLSAGLHNYGEDVDYLSGEGWRLVDLLNPLRIPTWVFMKEFRSDLLYKNELKKIKVRLTPITD